MATLGRRAIMTAMIALPGCGVFDGQLCTTEAVVGIVVEAHDAVTGAPLPSPRGAVRDGEFLDSLRLHGPGRLAGADERPGTYSIEVVHDGYLPWNHTGVEVRKGSCHVQTVTIVTNMNPAP